MQTYKGSDFIRGWFIGDFEPSIYKTADFEVGYLRHAKGEYWAPHFHKESVEMNYLIRGKMIIQGIELNAGDVFVFEKGEIANPEFLEDCELIVVKVPSLPKDKYNVE